MNLNAEKLKRHRVQKLTPKQKLLPPSFPHNRDLHFRFNSRIEPKRTPLFLPRLHFIYFLPEAYYNLSFHTPTTDKLPESRVIVAAMDPTPPVLPPSQPGLKQDDKRDVDEPVSHGSPKRVIADLDEHDPEDERGEDTDGEDGDEGDAKKWIVNPAPKRRKISERKRADNAAFDTWIENNHQNLSKGLSKLIVDDDKTVQALVKDFENKRIITSPRDYQLELFERAKTQNTIAVLDTGKQSRASPS